MSKAFKKLTGLLLAMLMVVTLIPVMGGKADAGTSVALTLFVNGEKSAELTKEQMESWSQGPQVFPFPGGQGAKWSYFVAQGPSYERVFKETLGINSLSDIKNATIQWRKDSSPYSPELPVKDLIEATSCFKLVDGSDADVKKIFIDGEGAENVFAVKSGAPDVVPVIAYKFEEYDNFTNTTAYTDAYNAAANETWGESAKNKIQPFIGGNLKSDTQLKKAGKVDKKLFNWVGKYSAKDQNEINIVLPKPETATSALTFTNTASQTARFNHDLTEVEKKLLGFDSLVWTSSDKAVATVDKNGKVTPAGKIGSCTVTATLTADGQSTVVGNCTVTVKDSAFAPAKPAGFKVKNIKKRTVKLTWKKAANADGYIVYRSTKKNKGYKKVKTLKGAKKVSYKNKKLKKGKKYYFKVKAYRNYQGKTLYSNFTGAKKVKIKK